MVARRRLPADSQPGVHARPVGTPHRLVRRSGHMADRVHALVRTADPYIALRYAHRIDPDVMAGFADGIDPTTWNARQAAARLRRRHDFTGEADMILKAKGL